MACTVPCQTGRLWATPATPTLTHASTHKILLQLLAHDNGELVELGVGGHSVVYLGRLAGLGEVAVKAVELQPGMDSGAVWREASLLRRCHHDRVVPLIGVAIKVGTL